MHANERYLRQMILPGFGTKGQEALQSARVLVVGIGGLGCPALQYLAGAGVGNLGMMDADRVSVSNLHRQLLFTENQIGFNKAEAAAANLQKLNSETNLTVYPFALTQKNSLEILVQYDVVIDGTDNFPAKYLINDACLILNKPFIYGAVNRFEGQVSVFNLTSTSEGIFTYRNLFPEAPLAGEIPSCEETGVIGVLPGMMGTLQAGEAIKIITGIGNPLEGRIYTFDLHEARGYEINIIRKKQLPLDKAAFLANDYTVSCIEDADIPEVTIPEFLSVSGKSDVFVLDVREKHEYPPIDFSDARIPMSELPKAIQDLPEKDIYIICHQGIRSIYAAQLIKAQRNLNVYSVKGGLTAYFK